MKIVVLTSKEMKKKLEKEMQAKQIYEVDLVITDDNLNLKEAVKKVKAADKVLLYKDNSIDAGITGLISTFMDKPLLLYGVNSKWLLNLGAKLISSLDDID